MNSFEYFPFLLTFIGAYLLGSIPSAVWLGKIFYKIDVRKYGSGNAGATNTFRVLGPKIGLPVLILDTLKGYFAVQLIQFITHLPAGWDPVSVQLVLGATALLGHILPVFAGFKGGKGIATLLGIIFAVHPLASFLSVVIFSLVFTLSKIVSLASITAAMSFPFIIILIFKPESTVLSVFSVIIAVLVLFTHRKNIIRILNNDESKFRFADRKNKDN